MKNRHKPKQIVAKLRQVDVELAKDLKVPEACKQLGIREPILLPLAIEAWRHGAADGQVFEGPGKGERPAYAALPRKVPLGRVAAYGKRFGITELVLLCPCMKNPRPSVRLYC